jgi:uncharacterized protein (DUF1330 family)
MPAYIITEVEIHNPKEYENYRTMVPASLEKYQGKFIVRGGKKEPLEGDWNPERIVVLEFPSLELAKAWWASPEYAPAKALRQRTSNAKMIVIEGYLGS